MLSLPLPEKVYELAEKISKNKIESNVNTNDVDNFLDACAEFDSYIERNSYETKSNRNIS